MAAVHALHGRKTVLIVAHRLSTVEHCDYLYRLDGGRISGQGAPAEVLAAAAGRPVHGPG
jgi:ABC-type multidrug transport system fused ATPase/permease subunit